MNQDAIIGLVFLAALGYLVNIFWNRSRKPSNSCGEGCNSCPVAENVDKIKAPLP